MSNCNIKRNDYLDFIKGIAIILVVLGHNIQYGSAIGIDNGFYEHSLFRFIYSFHMPLFMVVSGYLFYFTANKYTFVENVKSRFTRLVVPIVCWTILNYIIRCLMSGELLSFGPTSFLYSIWFLWAIFWCSLALLLVRRWGNDSLWIYLVLWVLLLFVPNIFLSNHYVYMYPYFVVGYLWNKYGADKLKYWEQPIKVLTLVAVGIILYVPLYLNFSQEDFIYKTGTCVLIDNHLSFSQLSIDMFRYMIGFIGIAVLMLLIRYAFIYFGRCFAFQKITSVIAILGKQSLGIYIISEYFINQMILKSLPNKDALLGGAIIWETLLILSLTSVLTRLIEKTRFSSKFLLGKN